MHIPEVDERRIGIMKEQQLRHATTVNPTGKTLMLLNVPAFLIPQDYLAFLGGCLRYIYIFICLFLIISIKYLHSTLLNSTLFCFHCWYCFLQNFQWNRLDKGIATLHGPWKVLVSYRIFLQCINGTIHGRLLWAFDNVFGTFLVHYAGGRANCLYARFDEEL